ncbi:hypothetical protein [Rhodococcoides fascians]|nr:hypothetical protein [Rhodococcus fascians]
MIERDRWLFVGSVGYGGYWLVWRLDGRPNIKRWVRRKDFWQ